MEQGVSGRNTVVDGILESLLEKPLGFEELIVKLKGKASRATVSKYLRRLVEGTHGEEQLIEICYSKTSFDASRSYTIIESKRQQAEELLASNRDRHEVANMLELATPQELKMINAFLITYPEIHLSAKTVPEFFKLREETMKQLMQKMVILSETLKYRTRLKGLIACKAPTKIIDIAKKLCNGEKQWEEIKQVEYIEFLSYPIDLKDTRLGILMLTGQEGEKEKSIFKSYLEKIREEDPSLATLLEKRYVELLGKNPFI